ncbi:DNA-methyltransferase [Macrococcus brunensis]|uniref:DNA-methyltransferase n=1 Tax=Macrococcus brunensis TaxID=198483 RepID=UPI001EF13728|nr:site-specific DNA-methyltransferase [Macrococcus brunensis]ULG73196.1 site-specific DNA-methyltransferase [Macrococcus brunensis]
MELYRDHFQNYKRYNVPKAQLIIADIPYNIGVNAYGSNPNWYNGGDIKNGESKLAKSQFFDTDNDFRVPEFMHFASTMLKKEPKGKQQAGCMIVFCAFDQQFMLIEQAKKYGFNNYINLVFRKNYSPQVLKANMKIVGNCEYAVLFYREKLPKFNNNGRMIMNCMDYERDNVTPKIHPTQKSIHVIQKLIDIFTDPGDVVIDPTAGSGVTLLAAENLGRKGYGFEIKKEFVDKFHDTLTQNYQNTIFSYTQQELINNRPPYVPIIEEVQP